MFQSFFIGGFECSTHRGRRGNRHDLVHATEHDKFVAADYRRLRETGITTVREGLRWHLIEREPERYDFSSVVPFVRAARREKMQILWDLFHYGYPDDLNPFDPDFTIRLAQFAFAFADFLREETDEPPFICPFNEISFYSHAAGERGFFAPYAIRRGDELKANCVRAAVAASEAVRTVFPGARLMHIEPVFHVVADPSRPHDRDEAERYRHSQFAAWDMIAGRQNSELGGDESLLDVVGVNYYWYNQWFLAEDPTAPGVPIRLEQPEYRPFHQILEEVYKRYERPIFIAETGAEDENRRRWLRYVCEEARLAMHNGVPIAGICWYPILNHPGWDDDRHCHNGLWDYCDAAGCREIYQPLAEEIRTQQKLFAAMQPQENEKENKLVAERFLVKHA